MISTPQFKRFADLVAAGPMMLRAGIVGGNFAVMMGLAALLGLEGFGQFAFLWGLAMVLGTVVSLGGPLVLLRQVSGGRVDVGQMTGLTLLWPLGISALLFWPLAFLFPTIPWLVILAAAFGVNALSCLASVLRGLGSVQLSMVLRDGAPQILLLLAAMLANGDVIVTLALAAGFMAVIALCVTAAVWLRQGVLRPQNDDRLEQSEAIALWGSAMLGVGVAQVDLIVGGLLFPPEVLGVYALLRRIANLVALPVSVATWVSAGPIAAAAKQGNMPALQEASVIGSRIAVGPGALLLVVGILGTGVLPFVMPAAQAVQGQLVFILLLSGAFGQVFFASGFPVATLCGRARDAALARLLVVLGYLGTIGLISVAGPISVVAQAVIYTGALCGGSTWLWYRMRRVLGVETSAAALWQRGAVAWRS